MNTKEFRAELVKIMPGYKWTVRRPSDNSGKYLEAIGTISAGFNRISTLFVTRREDAYDKYSVKSSGYGLRSPWLSEYSSVTLAQALRGLQNHYEYMANEYRSHAEYLESARKPEVKHEM